MDQDFPAQIEEMARQHFIGSEAGGFNWAESVLLASAGALSMESPFIPRIATGFGAGVGGQGSLCGALTGGLMAIGLRYGRSSAQDVECKESAYTLAQEFYRRFEAQMGSVLCREITGCDLTTPEGRVRFKVTDQHNRCADHVGKAAHILGELLVEDMSDERSTV